MAGGRPTDFKSEYCDKVIELGKEGMSRAEICLELDICYQTLLNWSDSHPEFLEALKTSSRFSQGWWEMKGRKATFDTEGFNSTSYIFNMKNRFKDDWSDTSSNKIIVEESLVITRTEAKE